MNKIKISSNRSFGIIFSIVFLIISLYPLLKNDNLRIWALLISFLFLFLGLINSKVLTPLNLIWFKFGIFLGKIVSPIIMGVIFFGVVTPIGFILRIFGKDVLSLKKSSEKTYWINKPKVKNDMKKQF